MRTKGYLKMNLKFFIGIFAAVLIAVVSQFIESLLPLPIIGASVIALLIGLALNAFINFDKDTKKGIQFMSKRALKFAIILLGASLNITIILNVGKLSLMVMIFTLITCFGGGYFVGKLLGLNWKLSNLISAGTGICGGSAIAAIAPVIDAEDSDIAYAMSATFLFDILMIILFPIIGKALGLSDMAYGLWAGTAVNDTSSVVAAGYAFSEAAGDFATMVKLTRTLAIIPTVLIFSYVNMKVSHSGSNKKGSVSSVFPWFIVFFLIASLLNSIGIISPEFAHGLKQLSKFIMVASLAAIGLNTEFSEMKKSGINPMIHGFIISLLVVLVALGVEYAMGIV